MQIARWLVAALLAAGSFQAAAIEMKLEEDRLYLHSTELGVDDYIKYRELVKGRDIRTVILLNQPGGNIGAAIGIADDLIERNVATVIAGRCMSACTILFLAGRERQFSARYPAVSTIGFHGSYNTQSGERDHRGWATVYSYYRKRLGSAVDQSPIIKALKSLNKSGFAYMYHPSFRVNGSLCEGTIEKACTSLPGRNALSENLITREELSDVSLPDELLPKDALFGIDYSAFGKLDDEGRRQLCAKSTTGCAAAYEKYDATKSNRAFVTSSTRVHYAFGFSDKRNAVRRAIFECSSRSASVCQLGAINDREAATLHRHAAEGSEKAIGQLAGLKAAGKISDPADSQELPMRGLRIGSYTAPAPEKIEGVRELATRNVVDLLLARTSVMFVDVECRSTTIPTARCVFGGGLASSDTAVDGNIEKNLLAVLQALTPDKSTPIALFCSSSQCWLAPNAAYRAAKAGYKVYWYRGGIQAWERNELPLVPNVPIGAVLPNAG